MKEHFKWFAGRKHRAEDVEPEARITNIWFDQLQYRPNLGDPRIIGDDTIEDVGLDWGMDYDQIAEAYNEARAQYYGSARELRNRVAAAGIVETLGDRLGEVIEENNARKEGEI